MNINCKRTFLFECIYKWFLWKKYEWTGLNSLGMSNWPGTARIRQNLSLLRAFCNMRIFSVMMKVPTCWMRALRFYILPNACSRQKNAQIPQFFCRLRAFGKVVAECTHSAKFLLNARISILRELRVTHIDHDVVSLCRVWTRTGTAISGRNRDVIKTPYCRCAAALADHVCRLLIQVRESYHYFVRQKTKRASFWACSGHMMCSVAIE